MKNTLRHIKNISSEAIFDLNGDTIDVETAGNLGIGHKGDSVIIIMGDKGQTLIEFDLSVLLKDNDKISCELGSLGNIYIKRIENNE